MPCLAKALRAPAPAAGWLGAARDGRQQLRRRAGATRRAPTAGLPPLAASVSPRIACAPLQPWFPLAGLLGTHLRRGSWGGGSSAQASWRMAAGGAKRGRRARSCSPALRSLLSAPGAVARTMPRLHSLHDRATAGGPERPLQGPSSSSLSAAGAADGGGDACSRCSRARADGSAAQQCAGRGGRREC